jgi:hypothetical protein
MKRWTHTLILLFFMQTRPPTVCSADADETPPVWTFYPAALAEDERTGKPWGPVERTADGRAYRWVTRLEIDMELELEQPDDYVFLMHAAIPHLGWRRQRLALYINNRFATEWLTEPNAHFHPYSALIPHHFWRSGENRITLRGAYRTRAGAKQHQASMAIESVRLAPSSGRLSDPRTSGSMMRR